MKKVLAISNNTFREAMRKKTLNVLLIFALIIIVSSVFFTYLSPGEEIKIIKDMGLGSIMFFGMLIAVFGASSLIPMEIEKKTISTVITKPVRRLEFVLGKFFGVVIVIFIALVIMGIVFLSLVYLKEDRWDIEIMKAITLTFFELVVVASITICVSTVASSLFNATFGIFMYIAGHLSPRLEHMIEHTESEAVKIMMTVLKTILPNFENFNVRNLIVVGRHISNEYLLKVTAYGLLYAFIIMVIAWLLFNEKEF